MLGRLPFGAPRPGGRSWAMAATHFAFRIEPGNHAMILAVLGLGGIGLWFLIAGDGAGALVGLALIALAGLFGFLLWVAVAVESPGRQPWPNDRR
jgi:hypothetical protein